MANIASRWLRSLDVTLTEQTKRPMTVVVHGDSFMTAIYLLSVISSNANN